MLEASIEPSDEPLPTMVCNSSMNNIIFFARCISSITAFILSSNCPRYFVPASISAISKDIILLFARRSGAFFEAITCANPSIIAVFPTPASPTRTGLFFDLLHKICNMRSISFSRPITGSKTPSCAIAVKSRPNAFKAGVLTLSDWLFP